MQPLKLYLQLLRKNDWWLYKISFLLTILFLSFVKSNLDITKYLSTILILILYSSIAASFVSLINDYYDQEEDRIANKKNGFLKLGSNLKRQQIILLTFGIIMLTMLSLHNKPYAFLAFMLGFFSYLFYSVKGIRLKAKGFWGVIADSAGAHFFSSLFVISYISYSANVQFNISWYFLISFWSFFFGLRGIIWHQHKDKSNDLISNTQTFLVNTNPKKLNTLLISIFATEMFLFFVILSQINVWLFLPLILYFVLLYLRKTYLDFELIIATNQTQKFHLIGIEFYEFILPISLLIQASIDRPILGIWIICFLFIFPKRPREIALDLRKIIMQKQF